ncbi:MAG: hypothetical protein ACK4N4_10945 [Burkholderiales bacterium]
MARTAAKPPRCDSTQRGQVLLGTVVLLGIVLGAVFYNLAGPTGSAIERDKITNAALAQAKDALIAFASGQPFNGPNERPGDLPCPDIDDNGIADSNCNSVGLRIGRLPWKTLGLPDLRDGSGERLWYAVSDRFKTSTRLLPPSYPLNSDTQGEYTVTGPVAANNVIAVVFAPGGALGSQDRNPAVNAPCPTTGTTIARSRCAANYLDGDNGNGTTSFATAPPSATFNDKLLLITSDTFFPAVEKRVANEARAGLLGFYAYSGYNFFPYANDYGDSAYQCTDKTYSGRIPQSTSFPSSKCRKNASDPDWNGYSWPLWFFGNNWHLVMFYAVSQKCTDKNKPACSDVGTFLTVNGLPPPNNNIQALVIASGRGFAGQTRPCANASDCLEGTENTNGDATFEKPVRSPTSNDQLVVVAP